MAGKSANVVARVEPEIKERAEGILNNLGVPVSVLINMVYRQIIVTNGIPFPLTLPSAPVPMEDMTRGEFDAMMEKGLSEAKQGVGMSAQDAFAELRRTI